MMSKSNLDPSTDQRFSSRWGFIISAMGIAVGTGNIWRFPRIVAQNGSEDGAGTFIVVWVCFLFLWSIPLIIGEYALGRKYRRGVLGTFISAIGKKFAWMGAFVAFVATAITFFYSVIVGWCIYYFLHMLFKPLPTTLESSMMIWDNYQSGGWPLLFHALAMGIGALVIWKGIRSIERVNKILIPSLLVIVVLALIRALTLEGAMDGVKYLFTPDWKQIGKPKIWMAALTQNAFDTGAGWGLFLTYAAYMQHKFGVVKNAFATGIGNNLVSLTAAMMIFGTAFAVMQTEMSMSQSEVLKIMKESGPASTGLTFIWMPQLFSRMFLGNPLSVLFFLGLTFAGFSSLIAQLELPSRILVDVGMKRSKAILIVIGVSYLFGIPSAMNLNFLSNQDFVWGLALMISGAFVAFMLIKHGLKNIRINEIIKDQNDWKLGKWWEHVVRFVIPLAAFILLAWWLALAVIEAEEWYNPFKEYSLMTCLVQWSLIISILLMLNKYLQRQAPSNKP